MWNLSKAIYEAILKTEKDLNMNRDSGKKLNLGLER